MAIDFRGAPYYDDSDYAIAQRYVRLLAIPGRNVQAREFTQAQTILSARLQRVAEAFLDDGDIVEGIVLSIRSDDTVPPTQYYARVSEGRIYAFGDIWDMEETDPELNITSIMTGDNVIGLKLTEALVTENEDNSLRDPAEGYDNYNRPGCHRYQVTPEWTIVQSEVDIAVFRLSNGVLTNVPIAGQFAEITDMLARRTYDESGHYLVRGIKVHATGESDPPDDNANIKVDPGKAFVLGYEITKPVATPLAIPKSQEYRNVRDEPHTYYWPRPLGFTLTDGDAASFESTSVNSGYGFNPMLGSSGLTFPGGVLPAITLEVTVDLTEVTVVFGGESTTDAVRDTINAAWSASPAELIAYNIAGQLMLRSPTCGRNSKIHITNITPTPTPAANYLGLYVGQYVDSPLDAWAYNHFNTKRSGRLVLQADPTSNSGSGTPAGFVRLDVDPDDGASPACPTWDAGDSVVLSHFATAQRNLVGTIMYPCVEQPVKQFITTSEGITARVYHEQTVVKGAPGGLDGLSKPSVAAILSVAGPSSTMTWEWVTDPKDVRYPGYWVGSGTVYPDTSYFLDSGGVDWSPAGPEPTTSTSYRVIYTYNKILLNEDEVLYNNNGDYRLQRVNDLDYADFSPSYGGLAGDAPLDNTVPVFDYEYYLARRDLIILDPNGNLKRVEGKSDKAAEVRSPTGQLNTLTLAMLELSPNDATVKVYNYRINRVTMNEIKKIRDRMNESEYNEAVTLMQTQSTEGEPPEDLAGIMADAFVGFDSADISYAEAGLRYDICMDMFKRELLLAYTEVSHDLNTAGIDAGPSTFQQIGHLLMNQYTSGKWEIQLQQNYGTEFLNINPYSAFDRDARITISPHTDNWIDITRSTVIQEVELEPILVNIWHDTDWSQVSEEEVQILQGLFLDAWGGDPNNDFWAAMEQSVTTRVNVSTTVDIIDEAITYMRERELHIVGDAYEPFKDDVNVKFDGREVVLRNQTTAATSDAGWVKADVEGKWEADFDVPGPNSSPPLSSVEAGEVTIVAEASDFSDRGEVNYASQGVRRDIITTITKQTVVLRGTDPLAQTFSFDNDLIVTGIGVYFGTIATSEPLIVQVREVINGYPGPISFGEKVMYPSNPLMLADPVGALETRVEFDSPIYLEAYKEYCLVLMAFTDEYRAAVGTLGQQDMITGEWVANQPYAIGNLFSSSNNSTWTAHQKSDLKFHIYGGNFVVDSGSTPAGRVEWNNIIGLDYTRFVIAAEWLSPLDTRATWEYSTDNGINWLPAVPFFPMEAGSLESLPLGGRFNQLKIRVNLFSDNPKVSPLVATNSLYVHVRTVLDEGNYFGRGATVTDPEGFNNVRQTLKIFYPPGGGTNVQVYFQQEEGGEWIENELQSQEILQTGLTLHSYERDIVVDAPDITTPARVITGPVGDPGDANNVKIISGTNDVFDADIDGVNYNFTIPGAVSPGQDYTPIEIVSYINTQVGASVATIDATGYQIIFQSPTTGWNNGGGTKSSVILNTIASHCFGTGASNWGVNAENHPTDPYTLDDEREPGSIRVTSPGGGSFVAGTWFFRVTALTDLGETHSEEHLNDDEALVIVQPGPSAAGLRFNFDFNLAGSTWNPRGKITGVKIYGAQGPGWPPPGGWNVYKTETWAAGNPPAFVDVTGVVEAAGLAPPSDNTGYYDVFYFRPRIKMTQEVGHEWKTPRAQEFTNAFKAIV